MQLKPVAKGVRRQLIAASCALLGATAARSQEFDNSGTDGATGDWVVDSALAYYKENNGRITAIEPVVNIRKDYGDGKAVGFNITYDSLSGASPNGALPSTKPQTFASPSGTSLSAAPQTYTTASGQEEVLSAPIYTVNPGELPMDPNYHDKRLALGGNWQLRLSRLTRATLGADVSYEQDFFSTSANASIAHDFNEKNTTLSLGVNGEFDSLSPIGGAPVPGSDYALFEKTGGKSKNGAGALLGLTQVMTRNWLAEFNVSADRFTGYLNDPYKIVSVIDDAGNTTGYLYEKRPDTRTRKSIYLENRLAWSRASVAFSMRYMTDDWSVRSDTAQLHVRWWNSERDRYLEPTVRWYRQTAAAFYTPWIPSSTDQFVTSASADERLGAFHALTYGIKYGAKLDGGSDLSIRLEYYQQTPDDRVPGPGALQGLDLYPGLKAIMLQVGWRFGL
jgi:hypothetical protein